MLEARDRIGGRVFTRHLRDNPELYCELGGEWVGDNHENVQELCREFGLDLIPHRFDFSFAELGILGKPIKAGTWPFQKNLQETVRNEVQRILRLPENDERKKEFDTRDWWTFLRDKRFSTQDLLRRDLMDSTDFGESIRQAGAYSADAEYYSEDGDPTDEMDSRIEGAVSLTEPRISSLRHRSDKGSRRTKEFSAATPSATRPTTWLPVGPKSCVHASLRIWPSSFLAKIQHRSVPNARRGRKISTPRERMRSTDPVRNSTALANPSAILANRLQCGLDPRK